MAAIPPPLLLPDACVAFFIVRVTGVRLAARSTDSRLVTVYDHVA